MRARPRNRLLDLGNYCRSRSRRPSARPGSHLDAACRSVERAVRAYLLIHARPVAAASDDYWPPARPNLRIVT